MIHRLVPMLTLAAVLTTPAGALTIAVPQDVLADYQRLVAGRPVLDITDFRGPGSRRDTVELILFQQALALGGFREPLEFQTIDSYARLLAEVSSGRTDASPTSVWATDVADSPALKSAPLIEDGEYTVGFYGLEGNTRVLGADLAALQTMTAVTNLAWKTDVKVLKLLGITHLVSATTFNQMAAMVVAGRGDFFMRSFKPGAEMAAEYEGKRFLPVRGLRVAFPGSRHYLVAPGARGQEILRALDQGLQQLRSRGMVRRAYTDAGFFAPQVESWPIWTPAAPAPHKKTLD